MSMIKRIFLFLLTNLAVLILINIVFAILSSVFGINISAYWYDYTSIFIFALVVWFAWSFISLFLSKWSAKRAYNIEIIDVKDLYSLWKKERLVYDIVFDLANKNGIKVPEVWIYKSSEPNAFATGATRNSSLVAVSTGLLDSMDEGAIKGVVGHEMAHILNGDMITMTLLQWVINTFVIFISRVLANLIDSYLRWDDEESSSPSFVYYIVSIILEIVLWILASTIVMWFSRHREYRADEGSAHFVWRENMIAGLKALLQMQNRMVTVDADKMATFKIGTKKRSGFMMLFSSHPALEDRIANLENMKI